MCTLKEAVFFTAYLLAVQLAYSLKIIRWMGE